MKEYLNNLKQLWRFIKDQKVRMILVIIINIMLTIISIVMPILSARIMLTLTDNKIHQLLVVAFVIFLIEIFRNIICYFNNLFMRKIYKESFTNIQIALGKEILKLDNNTIDEHGTGVFIQRLRMDTGRLADVFNSLSSQIEQIVANIGVLAAIFIVNKWVCLYVIITTAIKFVIEMKKLEAWNKKDKEYRKQQEKLTSFLSEIIRGIRDVKMLNAENSFMKEFEKRSIDTNSMNYEMFKERIRYSLINGSFYDVTSFGLIALLALLMSKYGLVPSLALVLYNYSGRVNNLIYYCSNMFEMAKDFNLSCSRIFAIIDSKEFSKEKFGKRKIKKLDGNFEFKNVEFGYKDSKVFDKLSFKIKSGETVAFVGKSGAGKTTIFNLLCKMYDTQGGKILMDGIDIQELDKDSIRGNITIISQNPYIFNLSIRENLKLVKEDLTEEEMIEACKTACLTEFIESLPDKYDTIIGEGGINISGGQKQRLAIARALIQKTKIILFDEATSALDNETQAEIQNAIDNMKGEYTILIIAHRLSTVENSDRILFLDKGKIQAAGTKNELMAKSKEFKKLYNSELKVNV